MMALPIFMAWCLHQPKWMPVKNTRLSITFIPGPQGGSVGSWSFAASRGDNQALAELGFIVVVIEGTSNPLRSKSFHDMNYGNMGENTLPDQITGIKQLAANNTLSILQK
jgi:dipeptidyl aminopeptidase/acylaminoacyl peptidase